MSDPRRGRQDLSVDVDRVAPASAPIKVRLSQLHPAMDEATGDIRAIAFTLSREGDSLVLGTSRTRPRLTRRQAP